MVSSLMTKHINPLGRGRAAGSDGAGEHTVQFRKLHSPEMELEVNSLESTFIFMNKGRIGLQNVPRGGH